MTLMDDGHGEPYKSINQYGCGWDCVQCDCTDCCPEEIYQERYSGYLVTGAYTLEPAPLLVPPTSTTTEPLVFQTWSN